MSIARRNGFGNCNRHFRRAKTARSSARDPYEMLGVERGADPSTVRRAYLKLMKAHHPDVNGGRGNRRAAEIIRAYHLAMSEMDEDSNKKVEDVFQRPEGPAIRLFINPFSCGVDPMKWRELLEAVRSRKESPENALSQLGVFCSDWSVHYLSSKQFEFVEALMVKMENNLSFEQTSWELDAWLLQAREAYARLPPEAWDNEEDGFGSSWARDRYEADGYR